MKKSYIIIAIAFLTGCQGSVDQSTQGNSIDGSLNTSVDSSTQVLVNEFVPEPLKEKNQITDYVPYFLHAQVVNTPEEMDMEKNIWHYYQTLDVANGYAVISGGYEGGDEFALWRMANGNDLVGHMTYSCGPVCDYQIHFYEINQGKETEVTNEILPWDEINGHLVKVNDLVKEKYTIEIDDIQAKFIVPQKGTDLEVYYSNNLNEFEFSVMTLAWDKSKFTVKKKSANVPTFN